MASIQICPPMPARGILPPETAFGLIGKQPVSVEFGRDGEIRSTGFDFGDYSRAQTTGNKLAGGRRLPCPAWALNSTSMAEVIARALERRAGFRYPTPGNPLDRLQRAQQCILAKIPRQTEIMTRLCREYASLKKLPDTSAVAARLKALQEEIENLDTMIRTSKEHPALVARAIYLYWRCGWDSPAVASELGMKPPHIRRTLSNLCVVARQIEKEKREGIQQQIRIKPAPKGPKCCVVCGAKLSAKQQKCCGARCSEIHTRKYFATYMREYKRKHRAARRTGLAVQKPSLTIEERKLLALRMWSQGASMGKITRAMGYRAGFGYNFLNRVLRNAGVRLEGSGATFSSVQ